MSPLAILTGASSGIGAAAAEQFIDQGYSVVNISRRDCPVPGVETLHTDLADACLLYTSPSPRDRQKSRMPSSA